MGRIYRSESKFGGLYFNVEDEKQEITLPIKTETTERFPRMSRRDRRKMERQIRTLVDRNEKAKMREAAAKGERLVILTDEEKAG